VPHRFWGFSQASDWKIRGSFRAKVGSLRTRGGSLRVREGSFRVKAGSFSSESRLLDIVKKYLSAQCVDNQYVKCFLKGKLDFFSVFILHLFSKKMLIISVFMQGFLILQLYL
jgi:hypothetical protein